MQCLKVCRFLLCVIIGINLKIFEVVIALSAFIGHEYSTHVVLKKIVTCFLNVISSVDSDLCLLGWCR